MFKDNRLVFLGIALACGMAGTADAATLMASGPVAGGDNQGQVACLVVNVGSAPIHFVTTQLVGQFRADLEQNFNDCTNRASLMPGATCSFQADVNAQGTSPHQPTSCKVTISESKANASVRGTMVALDPQQGPPLSQTDLH